MPLRLYLFVLLSVIAAAGLTIALVSGLGLGWLALPALALALGLRGLAWR